MHPLQWSVTHSLAWWRRDKKNHRHRRRREIQHLPLPQTSSFQFGVSFSCSRMSLVATATPTAPTIAPALPCHRGPDERARNSRPMPEEPSAGENKRYLLLSQFRRRGKEKKRTQPDGRTTVTSRDKGIAHPSPRSLALARVG